MKSQHPALLTVALIGLVTGCSQPRDIVFAARSASSPDSRTLEIFTMRPDGTGVRQLTAGAPGESSNFPVWSPDGRQIAYRNQGAIHVMDKDGEHDRIVVQLDSVTARRPQWSPDGRSILFATNDSSILGVSGFYIVRLDDGTIGRVPLEPGRYGGGAWHPDGLSFHAVRRPQEGPTTIIRVTAATGEAESILTSDSLYFEGPSISPDGSTLLVQGATFEPRSVHVFVMRPDGTDLRALTSAAGSQNNPRWSHDGRHVVMQCNPADPTQRAPGPPGPEWFQTFEVCSVALDGTDYRRLTHNAYRDLHPAW